MTRMWAGRGGAWLHPCFEGRTASGDWRMPGIICRWICSEPASRNCMDRRLLTSSAEGICRIHQVRRMPITFHQWSRVRKWEWNRATEWAAVVHTTLPVPVHTIATTTPPTTTIAKRVVLVLAKVTINNLNNNFNNNNNNQLGKKGKKAPPPIADR